MRSLILKDLYNIGHNAKSMLFVRCYIVVLLWRSSHYINRRLLLLSIE